MATNAPPKIVRLDSLTGVRAYFAILVFILHAFALFEIYPDSYNTLRPSGEGIAAFFVLSGFVMAWSFRPNDRAREFWQRRFAKIYPGYLVAWVLTALVGILLGLGFGLKNLFALTMLQTWVPDPSVYFANSLVFWSLSVESFFYLIFPFIIRPLTRLSERSRIIMIVGIMVFYVAKATVGHVIGGTVGPWLQYIFPPVLAADFVLGILICLQARHRPIPAPPMPMALALMLATFIGSGYIPQEVYVPFSLNILPCLFILLAAVGADTAGRPSFFRHPVMTKLGDWSYGMYLIHATILTAYLAFVRGVLEPDLESLTWGELTVHVLISFGISVSTSAVVYYAVEKPMNNLLRPRRRSSPLASTEQKREAVPSITSSDPVIR